MTEQSTGRACVAHQTASAKLVYQIMKHERRASQSRLITETGLDRSTVRRAVDALESCDVLEEAVDLSDARKRVYFHTSE